MPPQPSQTGHSKPVPVGHASLAHPQHHEGPTDLDLYRTFSPSDVGMWSWQATTGRTSARSLEAPTPAYVCCRVMNGACSTPRYECMCLFSNTRQVCADCCLCCCACCCCCCSFGIVQMTLPMDAMVSGASYSGLAAQSHHKQNSMFQHNSAQQLQRSCRATPGAHFSGRTNSAWLLSSLCAVTAGRRDSTCSNASEHEARWWLNG